MSAKRRWEIGQWGYTGVMEFGVVFGVMLGVMLGACGSRGGVRPEGQALAAGVVIEPAVPGKLPSSVFYVPGEVMEFDFSFAGIRVGSAVLAAGEPGLFEGRRQLVVRSAVEGAGVVKMVKVMRDQVTTRMDLDAGVPMEHQAELLRGSLHMVLTSRFRGREVFIEYQKNGGRPGRQRYRLPDGDVIHDAHSVLGALRGWQPADGEVLSFYGVSSRRLWHCDLRATSRETVRTAMGMYPAVRMDGVAQMMMYGQLRPDARHGPRTFSLWVSDDANRMPLRVQGQTEYGYVEMELTGYRRP